MERENENFENLPGTIIDRLRREEQSIAIISPKIDEIVLAAAASQFADRKQAKSSGLSRPARAAVAASVVLTIFVMSNFYFAPSPAPSSVADVDNSGRVDIVDVLALARSRERNPAAVSQAQINALMMQIVSLTENGDAS